LRAAIVVLAALLVSVIRTGSLSSASTFIRIQGPRLALTHVDVLDGTGAPVKVDQTVVIDNGRIASVRPASEATAPSDGQVLDLSGHTVFPGLVGMHDHLFYASERGRRYVSVPQAFARLYLAAGVTSIRTAGTIDLEQDIAIKQNIDAGREAGPKIHLSSPYVTTPPDNASLERAIEAMANAGVTTVKAYTDLGRAQLEAAIGAAHRRGLKVTGHLCAVGFREAAAMGIDNLEHGIIVDSEFHPGRLADVCPDWGQTVSQLATMNVDSFPIRETMRRLVLHGVAVTSTLAVFETLTARTAFFDRRIEPLLHSSARIDYVSEIERRESKPAAYEAWNRAFRLEMSFERRFVEAGGLLMAGADPTGWGGVIAGLADQRNVELLVEAGFSPEQAIQIASANGAIFLGESDRIGTVERGKQADLVVVRGHPALRIADIRNVAIVFKDGVGYDPAALTLSVQGGTPTSREPSLIDYRSWPPWIAVAIGPVIVLLFAAGRFAVALWRRPRQSRRV
jgi:imidazolonepropionase-like amidohydrolase